MNVDQVSPASEAAANMFDGATREALAQTLVSAAPLASQLRKLDELQSILRGPRILFPSLSKDFARLEAQLLAGGDFFDQATEVACECGDSFASAIRSVCRLLSNDPSWRSIADEVLASNDEEAREFLLRAIPQLRANNDEKSYPNHHQGIYYGNR